MSWSAAAQMVFTGASSLGGPVGSERSEFTSVMLRSDDGSSDMSRFVSACPASPRTGDLRAVEHVVVRVLVSVNQLLLSCFT